MNPTGLPDVLRTDKFRESVEFPAYVIFLNLCVGFWEDCFLSVVKIGDK